MVRRERRIPPSPAGDRSWVSALPKVCGAATISHGSSTAWKYWPFFFFLKHFLPDLRGHNVLVRTDNTSVVSNINHQEGLRSRPLYRLAHQILLWAQGKLLSLGAVHIPGHLNQGADILSRQGLRSREWRFQIWRMFSQAEVDLFASQDTAHCLLWFSLTHPAPLGLDAMVKTWLRLRLYPFSPIALLPGILERVQRNGVHLLLVAPFWLGWVWFSDLMTLHGRLQSGGTSSLRGGLHLSPSPGAVETVDVAPEGAHLIASSLSAEVVETILQSRAPSMRKLYTLKWNLFTSWCGNCQLDPVNSPVQCWSYCSSGSPQGYPPPPWRYMWRP